MVKVAFVKMALLTLSLKRVLAVWSRFRLPTPSARVPCQAMLFPDKRARGMKILAVDIGGTHAACAVVEGTQILAREIVSLPESTSLRAALVVIEVSLVR